MKLLTYIRCNVSIKIFQTLFGMTVKWPNFESSIKYFLPKNTITILIDNIGLII